MSRLKLLFLPALLMLPGCGPAEILTAPVSAFKTGGKVVDVMTTSQSEKDEKRGRELRKREERLRELEHDYRKQARKCQRGNQSACRKAGQLAAEMRRLSYSPPYRGK